MKTLLREHLTDLKAAIRIGLPESIEEALDGIRALPDEEIPPNTLPLLGQALASLQTERLKPLLDDPDPAIRGMGAIAAGERFWRYQDIPKELLTTAADDPNPEIRKIFAQTFAKAANTPDEKQKLGQLAVQWLTSTSTGLIETGLYIYPFSKPDSREIFATLEPMHLYEEHTVREALVVCLSKLGEGLAYPPVFELLLDWALKPNPNIWVITRTLSAGWALEHHQKSIEVLNELVDAAGLSRPIVRALALHQPHSH